VRQLKAGGAGATVSLTTSLPPLAKSFAPRLDRSSQRFDQLADAMMPSPWATMRRTWRTFHPIPRADTEADGLTLNLQQLTDGEVERH
jgi:hypothetical protein